MATIVNPFQLPLYSILNSFLIEFLIHFLINPNLLFLIYFQFLNEHSIHVNF